MTAAHERTPRLWIAIGFITVSCIVALIIGEKLPGVVFLILAALTFITNSFWGIEVIALPIVIPLAVVAYLVAGFVL